MWRWQLKTCWSCFSRLESNSLTFLQLVKAADVKLRFLVDAYSRDSEDEMWPRFVLSLWYDFKKLLWQDELNPRVRCAFGNVFHFESYKYNQIISAGEECSLEYNPILHLMSWGGRQIVSRGKVPQRLYPIHICVIYSLAVFLRRRKHVCRAHQRKYFCRAYRRKPICRA